MPATYGEADDEVRQAEPLHREPGMSVAAMTGGEIEAGKHAIVTGGSSGIGLATAKLLAARGMNVSILARNVARLAAACEEIERHRREPSQRIAGLPVDVAERQPLEAAIRRAIGELGAPRVLVASAGIAAAGYFLDIPAAEFERTMEVNYFGTIDAVRAVVPDMRMAGGGHIVLVSSGAGLIGILGYAAYCPTKFALRGFAEALRPEAKRWGIGVSIVYPPDTDTPGFHEEERTKPPETRKICETASLMSADAVARAIVRGIDRGRFSIAPGWPMGLLHRATIPFDAVIARYLDWLVGVRRPRGAAR
jgi:3-dehydrosphinganine reductase